MIAEVVSKTPAQAIGALRADQPVDDPKLSVLASFTRLMVESRGRPTKQDVEAFLTAGYGERHVLEIILAIGVKTLSNYANHVFHTRLDPRFEEHAWEPPRK